MFPHLDTHRALLVFSLISIFCPNYGTSLPGDRIIPELSEALQKILEALQSALGFVEQNVREANLDGVIGIRLVEGQLDVLLKRVESGELRLSQATEDRIRVIQQTSNRLADIGAEAVEKSQPVYFEQIGGLLRPSFWTLDRSSRSVDLSLHSRPVVDGEAIHESDSDKCLWELLGTDPRHSGEKCRVSQKCWAMMTAPGYKMYSLTHEVFYLQIAEQLGCLRHELPVTLRLTDEFCSNAYVESAQIATDGFPEQHKDLFMEQAALCGMSGYRDFFNREWLDSILAWQRTGAGCWGLPLDGPDDTSDLKRRVKREERVLTDGCEFHRTAVALGALSQYTRYVIEYSQKYLF